MSDGRGARYQGYDLLTGLEQAAALFREKYGYAPAEVVKTGGAVKVGPIVETASQAAQEQGSHIITPGAQEIMGKPPKTRAGGLLARVAAAQRHTSPSRARQLALEWANAENC